MEKEDLISYRHKINNLNEKESELRDEYLESILDGDVEGPLVGDAFVDKPWLNRYSDDKKTDFSLKNNLYQTYLDMAKDRLDEIAVYVYETKKSYTHRQIIDMVEKASSGLILEHVTMDSKVGVMLNGSIEEVVTFLALQKIGATAKYIDYMKSVPAMKHNIEEDNLDYLIMDECFLPLNQIINEKGIKVSVANTNKEYDDNKLISFDKLYELGNDFKTETVPYEEDKVCLIINSSGTTGNPKPICHTSYGINSAIKKMLYTDFPIKDGNVILKMIPSQIGLGVVTSMFTGLISGCQVVLMVAKPNSDDLIRDINDFVIDFPDYIKNHNLSDDAKINVFTAPLFARGLINDERVTDLSKIGSILAAGSKMGQEELDRLGKIAKEKGCTVPICNGYGQNEMAGAIALNVNDYNHNGSAGFPTYKTDVVVVDPETHEFLGTNEVGLILEKSGSKFKEYENLPEKTEESKIYIDGIEYFNTCDLGYMNEDGFLYITGRTSRVVIRSDFKISLDDIERKVRELDVVKDCATIKGEANGSMEEIVLFVELSNPLIENKEVNEIIMNYKELSPFEQPSDIVVVEKIPYKDNGKIDYKLLEKEYLNQMNETRKYQN